MKNLDNQYFGKDKYSTSATNAGMDIKNNVKVTSIKPRLNLARQGKDGTYPLVIQIIRNRRKRLLYTPFRLYKKEFHLKKEMACNQGHIRKRMVYIRKANEYLMYICKELENIREILEAKKDPFTVDDIIRTFEMESNMSCLFTFADYFIHKLKDEHRYGTAANYQNAMNAFLNFIKDPTYSFDQLSFSVIDEYATYLKKQKCQPNTVSFYIRHLRAIYNKAIKEGIVKNNAVPFKNINLKELKTLKRAITKEEINRILQFETTGTYRALALAKDVFIFSLSTCGMSFVDIAYLTKDNLQGDYLCYSRKKTGQYLQIKIEPLVWKLLEKYADPDSLYLLPLLRKNDTYEGYRSIQRCLNKHIREIGEILGFVFPLTFYVARHSWATLARNEGIPTAIISEGMGHTSEKTTLIYLAQMNQQIINHANQLVMRCWS